MKKKIGLLLASLFLIGCFILPNHAGAGVGNTKSGGSSRISGGGGGNSRSRSWSGGGSSRRSYSSSSGSGTGGDLSGLIMIGAIGLGAFQMYQKSRSDESDASIGSRTGSTEERTGRPIQNNLEAIHRVKKLDPNFSEDRFLSKAKLTYLRLQSAWTEKDWNSVRELESQNLFEQHRTQLQEHIRAHTTNVLERVRVENAKIKAFYENPHGNDTLEVILSSTMRDYIKDDRTGKVLEGNPREDLFTVYRMNFIRQHGSQTEWIHQDEVISDHCPNCGAPLTIDSVSQCEYCQASLVRNPKDWVLDTYEVVDEYEFYR